MIAIHNSGNWSFRPEWEAYCKSNNISYKLVNAYGSDIIEKVKDCNAFMFHYHHMNSRDYNFAKQLMFSLEQSGMSVFPNFNTGWHFDDKLGQKYLLESIGAPLVPTYAFHQKEDAFNFINNTSFPKVFKLRGGAGSSNVSLIKSKKEGITMATRAFGKGFANYKRWGDLKESFHKYNRGQISLTGIIKSIRRLAFLPDFGKTAGRERGYLLLQDFIPNNKYDIRVITINDKAFAIKRPVRDGDFRASGSGKIIYDPNQIDEKCISIAFECTDKLKAQCVAYDFVFDTEWIPKIVEISFGFAHRAYDKCPGYWDKDLLFIEGRIDPCGWMLEEVLKQ